MLDPTNNPLSRRQNIYHLSIYLFFLASLAATAAAWLITVKATENRLSELFYLGNNNISTRINTRFNTYLDILTGVQAFVEISNGRVSLAEWNDYINRLDILKKHPGLRSVNYIQKVPFADKDSFVKKLIKDNINVPVYQNYDIRAIDTNYVKDQPDYYPVVYTIGLLDDRFIALGLDLSSEKKRAETLFAARDSARPTTTPLIRFVPSPHNLGFSLILPIYQRGLTTDTVKQLRQAMGGAIYAPFDVNQFFDAILKPNLQDAYPYLDLEVYDPESERPNEPLYDKDQSISLTRDPSRYAFTSVQTISLPNRRWEIAIGVPKKFITDPRWVPTSLIILVSGALASLATFSLLLHRYRRLQTNCQE